LPPETHHPKPCRNGSRNKSAMAVVIDCPLGRDHPPAPGVGDRGRVRLGLEVGVGCARG
jgi:hypothetical protein